MRIYGNINSFRSSGSGARLQNLFRRRRNSSSYQAANAGISTDLSSLINGNSSTKSSTDTSSNIVSETYEKIGTSAVDVSKHASKLLDTGKNDLFDEDEVSNDKAVKEIKNYVEDYNSLVTQMQKSGSKTYKTYANELKAEVTSAKSNLDAVGITCKADGTLFVNSDKLTNSKISDLKKIFQGSKSFCAKVNEKCTTVNKRAALDKAISSYTGGTSRNRYRYSNRV